MVKRHAKRTDELLLIPFLDILCSLIGVLVLIIVVLVVAQTQKISGRTPEELQRAQEHQRMLKELKENERINALLTDKAPALEKLQQEAKDKEQAIAKLRKLLDTSANSRAPSALTSKLTLTATGAGQTIEFTNSAGKITVDNVFSAVDDKLLEFIENSK